MIIAIGGDHAGFTYKAALSQWLQLQEHEVIDIGPFSEDSVDYPDFAHPLAETVATGKASLGVLICGSGNGVCMTANKHQDIRAALVWEKELARLARSHNNANVLCLPARFISVDDAVECLRLFIDTEFEGGRHETRVGKISC